VRSLSLLLVGLLVAVTVYLVRSGRIVFLPILLVLPLGFFSWRRR
jgi:hypothetical protein